ncbi:MAG: hypothetical protein ACRCSG_00665 [Cellulosilyticaceae bacterium]
MQNIRVETDSGVGIYISTNGSDRLKAKTGVDKQQISKKVKKQCIERFI